LRCTNANLFQKSKDSSHAGGAVSGSLLELAGAATADAAGTTMIRLRRCGASALGFGISV